MNYQLINDHFTSNEAIEILTKLYYVKIKFYENKILKSSKEEEIKLCKKRIIELQKQLFEIRLQLDMEKDKVNMNGFIQL